MMNNNNRYKTRQRTTTKTHHDPSSYTCVVFIQPTTTTTTLKKTKFNCFFCALRKSKPERKKTWLLSKNYSFEIKFMCFVNHHHLHSFIHSTYAHTLYISLSQYIYHLYMNIKELMKKTKRKKFLRSISSCFTQQ